MTKLRNIIIAITLVLCGIFVGACGTTASAEQNYPLKIWKHNENGSYETLCLVDNSTGVNYIVVGTQRGNGELSVAITPRLNADGTLYCSGK